MDTAPGRRRRQKPDREMIAQLLEQFATSNMTTAAFCEANDLAVSSFRKWLIASNKSQHEQGQSFDGFAAVHVVDAANHEGDARLFAEVKGVRIFQPVTAAYLKELAS